MFGTIQQKNMSLRKTMTLYVNEEKIEPSLIETEIDRLRPDYHRVFKDQPKQEQEKQLAEWAREDLIEAALFRQQARKSFPQIELQEIQNTLQQLLQHEGQDGPLHQRLQAGVQEQQEVHNEIVDQIQQERLHSKITETILQPSEKQITRYYDQHLADRFTIPEMVHAAHIVKHPNTEEDTKLQFQQMCQIKEKLDRGIAFEELTEANSDCPDSAGDLGFFARGKMVPAFEEVAFNLESGSYSDVFETEFGWHIAKVIEKRPSTPCSLEQVRKVIVQDLTRQAEEKALEQFLDRLRKEARIEER
jgi:peptidyl-prolyl cis-trans isomerase C